jgi:hypothetical protein
MVSNKGPRLGYVPFLRVHDPEKLIPAGLQITPEKWLPISRLATKDWERFRPLLHPGYFALKLLNDWIWTEYAVEVHEELSHTLSDAFLLLEATFEMCEIPVDPQDTVVLETY